MAGSNQPMRLDKDELFSPKVDAFLEEQQMLRRDVPEMAAPPLVIRIIYSSYFYLSIAGAAGAVCGWALWEPHLDDSEVARGENSLAWILLFPTVIGLIGLFLGAVEGIMCRNAGRAFLSAIVGLGVGFGAGLVSVVAGGIIFSIMSIVAISLSRERLQPGQVMPTGFGFLMLMMGRAAAWAVISIPAGLGQGIALREKKVALNGLLGAVLGGLLGGFLFDPIYVAFTAPGGKANISRLVGFTVIGILVGLFVGLVEQWTKTAWLLMKAGPLAGKQFVLYRNPTVLGSSPKADVYLFKDSAIEPRHALIHNRGGRFEIEDCNTPDGTYVNGIPIDKRILQAGDQIVLGKTVLEFSIRESS
jgi:hypothetical protein